MQCGSCWAFSGIAAIESRLKQQTGKEYDLSEAHIVSGACFSLIVIYFELPWGGERDLVGGLGMGQSFCTPQAVREERGKGDV